MVIYPGTTPTKITPVKSASGSATLSEITMTSHAGTHIDAPSHAISGGMSISELDLDTFYGLCRVVDLTTCQTKITKIDLIRVNIKRGEKILLKTANSINGFTIFDEAYIYLDPEGATYLAELEISLLGIDALSVKQRSSKENTAHTVLLSNNIPIIEGLDLGKILEGSYILCALPLAFEGIDGSPTRAILMPI